MKYPKFIIYDNKIILGKVQRHKDMLPDNADMSLLSGGGFFSIDRKNKIVILGGKSFDFGKFDIEKAQEAEFENKQLAGYKREIT